jgi:hypothetical protein
MTYLNQLNEIESQLTEKEIKKYQLDCLKRLDAFLIGKVDHDIIVTLGAIVSDLSDIQDKESAKLYKKRFCAFKQKLEKDYNFHEKGALQSKYLGVGIAIGSGIGVALIASNPAFYSIGIGCGLAIGAGIGNQKEKEAAAEGRIY